MGENAETFIETYQGILDFSTENFIISESLPNPAYHSQSWALNHSRMVSLVKHPPARIKWDSDHVKEGTDAMRFGSAAHSMILEGGKDTVVTQAASFRTKAGKEEKKKIEEENRIPITPDENRVLCDMRAAIEADPYISALIGGGVSEKSIFCRDGFRWVRIRPDLLYVRDNDVVCVDYKTCTDASAEGFARNAYDYGYHQQAALYIDVLEKLYPCREVTFLFVAQEKTAPYLYNILELDPQDVELGRILNGYALRIWESCAAAEKWESYTTGQINSLSLPGWARSRAEQQITQLGVKYDIGE